MEQEGGKILVVGAGLMGHGIAQMFAQGGFRVSLVDTTQDALVRKEVDDCIKCCTHKMIQFPLSNVG
jgi:3-hydroxyacyl-CoA dehydrogenase